MNLSWRWKQHIKAANRESNFLLYRAIRKYGVKAFTIEILDESDNEDDLFLLEFHWITYLGTNIIGYNMTNGGEGTAGRKYVMSQKHKQKLREINLGKIMPNEQKEKIRKSMLGKNTGPRSKETKDKISKANRGKTSPNLGKSLSEETKLKISNSVSRYFEELKRKKK